jgi:predicted nuclease of predicted toxin-antitoxin system
VAERADDQDRIVVTKDRDFRDSHLLSDTPRRLLVVATGNISNNALLELFEDLRTHPATAQ